MTHNAIGCNTARTSSFFFYVCLCVHEHILHACHCTFLKGYEKKSAIRGAEAAETTTGGGPWRAELLGLGASSCPLRAPEALALHSFFPDTNQTQQHKHIRGLGVVVVGGVFCVKQTSRGTEKKTEMLTHKQYAPSFNPQFRALFFFFHILLSVSPS